MTPKDAPLIGNRYQILDKLGEGGMGTVCKGTDTQTGESVAIKLLKPELIAHDPDILKRFQREGDALRQLNHPNIVKMLAMVEEDSKRYLVMEYVDGGDLSGLLRQSRNIPIDRLLNIAIELADALTRAHHLKIIHRDLKPANVLIADDGTPRLTDFGVAYMTTKERITGTGFAIGTPHYMSPEALNGDEVDNRTDIWAFGIMLFEMLAGRLPFTGKSLPEIVSGILRDPLPDLEQLCPDAPLALVDLIYRMLEKDRNYRIRSMRLVGAELEMIIQGIEGGVSLPPATRRFSSSTPVTGHPKHNLPAQVTPFVGREAELDALVKLIDDPAIRLVTILAPGGMGKSRLALALGEQILQKFPNGVWFVDLAPLSDPENIPSAIATATGFQFVSDNRDPKQQILDYLSNKKLLLIMDNYEHLLDGAALVNEILQTALDVTVLATSRERLNLTGEQIFALSGMDFPEWETPEDAVNYAAVRLFMQSAKRIRPDFELRADDLSYLARICRLVAGMPLAIVLAASWVESLLLEEIAEEISRGLDILETDLRDIPERQRSIESVFDYSWQRLTESEREVFAKASVFRGGFTRQAAQAVTGVSLRILQSVVNKGLFRRDAGNGRYYIHELLRQYAAMKLDGMGYSITIKEVYYSYYLTGLSEQERALKEGQMYTVIADMDNIRLAWQLAISAEDVTVVRMAAPPLRDIYTFDYWGQEAIKAFENAVEMVRSQSGDGERDITLALVLSYLADVIQNDDQTSHLLREGFELLPKTYDTEQQVLAHVEYAGWARFIMPLEQAEAYIKEVVSACKKYDFSRGVCLAYSSLSRVAVLQGKNDEAKTYIQQALRLSRQFGDTSMVLWQLRNSGTLALKLGEYKEARAFLEEAATLSEEIDHPWGKRYLKPQLAQVALIEEDYQRTKEIAEDMLELAKDKNDRISRAIALNLLANVAASLDDDVLAQQYLEEELILQYELQSYGGIASALHNLGVLASRRGDFRQALAYFEESLPYQEKRSWGKPNVVRLWCNSAEVHLKLGNGAQARIAIRKALQLAVGFKLPPMMHAAIATSAMIVEQDGQSEYAVTLLAAAGDTDTDKSDILLAKLRTKLGEETYNAAWERGKSLDLETVVKELIDEFGGNGEQSE